MKSLDLCKDIKKTSPNQPKLAQRQIPYTHICTIQTQRAK